MTMDDRAESRRAFLRTAVRWLVLPGAAAGLGHMAARRGEKCKGDLICSRCGVARSCVLPQAVSYRTAKKEEGDG